MKLLLCAIKQGQKKDGCQYGCDYLYNNINNRKFETIAKVTDRNRKPYDLIYREALNYNNKILTLGGDHSVGLPSVMASLHKYKEKLKVVWVDAHADINTQETSLSSNKHGMPVSPLFGLMEPWIKIKNKTLLQPNQFVYIGLRNVDEPEKKFIEQLGISAFYSQDVKTKGIDKIMNSITQNENSIYHLSFDIDGLDKSYAPSTGTPEFDGLSLNEGKYIVDALCKTNKFKAYDLVEYNPLIGNKKEREITHNTCLQLLEKYLD